MSFGKILIANRGEIACRILRTARTLGYQTVAVFSAADRDAVHVGLADEAVYLGAADAAASYLNIDALLAAARKTGADAVHPGYGFLSENAGFAQACADAGLVLIGPPAAAIATMGDKAVAKRHMRAAGVPCAPGYLGEAQDDASLRREADALGYPLLVKAVAGGGGRGMRLVHDSSQLQVGLDAARREALSAFGDATLMLERLIANGRHIEIQVFADSQGHAIYLGERDCTVQRRRQKVLEESPSPIVSPELRAAMGRDAVAAALAVGYQGAGTVEFMVDEHLRHYFLEMNTRLQVEHPVTELVTGLDLVEWQLRVAAGEALPLTQEQVAFHGHAIEARLYAEDPYQGFTPQTGTVLWWQPQRARAAGVRVDDGIRQGGTITPHYDPMVAKFIAHGRDRTDALRRLRAALAHSPLLGVGNNARFLHELLAHPSLQQAQMTTGTLDAWLEHGDALFQPPATPDADWRLAALAFALRQGGDGWRSDSVAAFDLSLQTAQAQHCLRVRYAAPGQVCVDTVDMQLLDWCDGVLRYAEDGVQRSAIAVWQGAALHLARDGGNQVFTEVSAFPTVDPRHDPSKVCAPVAGRVTQLLVAPDDVVQAGQPLLCIEAMKMEMWLSAQAPGRITALHCSAQSQVEAHAVLLELQPHKDA